MLDSNAQRLRAYVEAYQALGDESYRETAQGILDWLYETMLDEDTGAFRGSQDAVPEYYNLATREARSQRQAPECDTTLFTNWNAMAVCSLLEAGVVLDEPAHHAASLAHARLPRRQAVGRAPRHVPLLGRDLQPARLVE